MVKKLVRLGASLTVRTSAGCTALYQASFSGFLGCAALVLGRPGASKMTPNEVNLAADGKWTALHTAAAGGYLRVCGVLIQAGARLDLETVDTFTPLMLAHTYHPGNVPLLQLLSGNWAGPLPGTACERCFTVPDSALMHCSGCLTVSYCCPRCAKADWPRHAAYCKERRAAKEARLVPRDRKQRLVF